MTWRRVGLVVGVALFSAVAGAGGGYAAAVLHPVPGPAGAPGPAGPQGPRGFTGAATPTLDNQHGVCVLVGTTTDYKAIPPATYVTNVSVSSPFSGSCVGRGTFVAVG